MIRAFIFDLVGTLVQTENYCSLTRKQFGAHELCQRRVPRTITVTVGTEVSCIGSAVFTSSASYETGMRNKPDI